MIGYLIDSSALWRLLRDDRLRSHWAEAIALGMVRSCAPQRIEFQRSARNVDEREQMSELFADLYPDVPVPKDVWRWIDTAQHRLSRHGAGRALSVVDLLVCGTAAAHHLTVLHDDGDFETASRHLTDVAQQRIGDREPRG